jgi:uncharacterized protein
MPRYDVAMRRDVRIPTGEPGVTLSGDLFLPEGAGPVPLLLTVLPYRRDALGMSGSSTERWFAARGYACLLVDFRGTGSSDGRQRPAFHPDEADDALAAIDWAVGQPWCDGNVGMWGGSYGSIMSMRTASRQPAALRAIIAWEGMIDPERDFVHPGGARGALASFGSWAIGTLFGQLLPPLDDYADPAEQTRWRRRLSAEPYLLDMFRHGPGDPAWAQRRIDASLIEVPALCLAGWRDLFVDGQIRAYEQMRGPKQLIAGPWLHTTPHDSPFAPIDFLNLCLAWWDRWLRGIHNGAEGAPPVRLYVQGDEERWLAFDEWVPAGAVRVEDLATWRVDMPEEPDPTVGALSGLWSTPAGGFGLPLDQHADDAGSLCYTSPPLTAPLLVSGRPRVTVAQPWPRVSVKLTDVDELGRSILICAGLESTPEGAEAAEVTLTPTTYQLPAGHRLRVVVAPGDFPRVWPVRVDPIGWPTATTLALPLPAGGREVELPEPDPEDQAAAAEALAEAAVGGEPPTRPVWTISNELLEDTVSVRLGLTGVGAVRPPGRKHILRQSQELVATANRAEPDASTITGTTTATVDAETGEHVTVDVEYTITPSGYDVSGRVTLDGETLLDHRWRA